MKKVLLFNKIPLEISPEQNTLVIFDIDGVICKSDIKLPRIYEDFKNIPEELYRESQRRCVITDEFKETVKKLNDNGIEFEFLTARDIDKSKDATVKMFENAGLKHLATKVTYTSRKNDKISQEQYTKGKITVINTKEKQRDKIYYIDDNDIFVDLVNNKKGKTVAIHFCND